MTWLMSPEKLCCPDHGPGQLLAPGPGTVVLCRSLARGATSTTGWPGSGLIILLTSTGCPVKSAQHSVPTWHHWLLLSSKYQLWSYIKGDHLTAQLDSKGWPQCFRSSAELSPELAPLVATQQQPGRAAAASQNPTFQRSKYAAKLRKWFRRNMECKKLV